MKLGKLFAIALFALAACHNAEPPQLSDKPVTSEPATPAEDTAWLGDPTTRIEGEDLNMRSDIPGVMLITRPTGTVELVNIDNGFKVIVASLPDYSLTIDGRRVSSVAVDMVKESDRRQWLKVHGEHNAVFRIVIPKAEI